MELGVAMFTKIYKYNAILYHLRIFCNFSCLKESDKRV